MRAALGYDRSYTREMLGENDMADYTYATASDPVKFCDKCKTSHSDRMPCLKGVTNYTYAECTKCGDVKPCGECGIEGISHDAPCRYWDCEGVYSH